MPDQQTNIPSPQTTSAIAEDWELWEKLLSLGNTAVDDARELAIEQAVEAFLNGMPADPAYQADAVVEGVTTPIVASRITTLECDIKTAPGTNLHIGDIVECLDEKWIVVELYTDKVGIINGKMWVCNDILRFQNNSAPIITRYCVIDDGSYSRKTTDPAAYVPVNTYKLYCSMDSSTLKLFIDKRLSFGTIFAPDGNLVLEVYKVMGIDLKSRNFGEGSHLMVLTLQRDVYNESNDDIATLICDAYVDSGDTPSPSVGGSCTISGRDAIRIGTTKKYTATFLDQEGSPVAGVAPVWVTSVPDGVIVSINDGVVSVEVPMNESLIGGEITITVKDEGNIYGSFEKKVQVITVG